MQHFFIGAKNEKKQEISDHLVNLSLQRDQLDYKVACQLSYIVDEGNFEENENKIGKKEEIVAASVEEEKKFDLDDLFEKVLKHLCIERDKPSGSYWSYSLCKGEIEQVDLQGTKYVLGKNPVREEGRNTLFFSDGELCEFQGKPSIIRTAEVSFYCIEEGDDRIFEINESDPCSYFIKVATKSVCVDKSTFEDAPSGILIEKQSGPSDGDDYLKQFEDWFLEIYETGDGRITCHAYKSNPLNTVNSLSIKFSQFDISIIKQEDDDEDEEGFKIVEIAAHKGNRQEISSENIELIEDGTILSLSGEIELVRISVFKDHVD